MTNNKKVDLKIILIMGLLTAIGPLSIDMYLPAFPAIAKSLGTTVSEVTLSLSSFFIGISAGQMLYGPLLDRYGRKKPLYAGLCLFFLASVGCAFAPTVSSLILFRFLQAVGGCVGMVAARAMVRDLFTVKDSAKIFSTLMLVVSVSPIMAPTIGGYITAYFGWRAIFFALIFIVSIILAGTYFYLPESKQPDPSISLKPKPILRSFAKILKHPLFITYALTGAISYAGLYAYIGGAPFVFMELFKVSETQFGWIFAFISIGLIGASQLNNIALKYFSNEKIILVASGAQSIIGVLFASFAFFGFTNLISTVLLVFLFLVCQGFIFPNTTALALAPLSGNAGNASGLLGAMQMTVGGCAAALISFIQDQSTLPMAGIMAFCAVVAFIALNLGNRFISQSTTTYA
ncbi:multidrug effflux MFS transporter [Sphingobacterium faecium]|uniref:multidrug effflux MFS transporter n=1 Tax=Sphingobacterium faecium TaxID=34087 RepID=UPI0024692F27|nr:multidrug effflux MFS transporter [Sphingobacterium faecium]MDH5826647.1 multidrug effflux MFS transporter [Sphingobacterium faecium]